jgi:ABC-type transport system substrate-binding protein
VGGIKIKMMYPGSATILEHDQHLPIFLQQMNEAGIEVEQEPQDFGSWVANFQAVNYDCSLNLNQMYETPELPLAFHTERGPFGDGSYIRGLGDPEIEAAVRKASSLLDLDERIAAVHEAQKVIYEKDPMTLALVTPFTFLAWNKRVRNIPTGIGSSSFLVNTIWLDEG